MKTLKEKLDLYYTTGLNISTMKIREDVKEAVLEFKKELNFDLKYLMQDKDICMDAYGLKRLLKKYKEIFGDFGK